MIHATVGGANIRSEIPHTHIGGKLTLLLGVLVAASAWVPTAAFGKRQPIPVHVPDVRLVPEMIEEAGYDPNQPHGSVFAPIAGAEGEERLLRVRRGALRKVLQTSSQERLQARPHEAAAGVAAGQGRPEEGGRRRGQVAG